MSIRNEDRLLEIFYDDFMKAQGVRELARKTKLSTATVQKILKRLLEERMIVKTREKGHYAVYRSNIDSRLFKYRKSTFLIDKIYRSGLIEFLEKKTKADAIVLFGSVAKGDYHKNSDIDIFIHGEKIDVDTGRFDKILGKEINLLFEHDLSIVSEGFLNNVAKGYTLSGTLRVSEYRKKENVQ